MLDIFEKIPPCEFSYKMVFGDLVEIQEPYGGPPSRFNEESLVMAFNHVRESRKDFDTQAAWERQMQKYRGALAFLKANLNLPKP